MNRAWILNNAALGRLRTFFLSAPEAYDDLPPWRRSLPWTRQLDVRQLMKSLITLDGSRSTTLGTICVGLNWQGIMEGRQAIQWAHDAKPAFGELQ
jgi:hypothetical protein